MEGSAYAYLRDLSEFMARRNHTRPTIKTNNVTAFGDWIGKHVELIRDERAREMPAQFCGVQIIADEFVPPGFAVLMRGDEVEQIIDFRDAS